VEPVRCATPGWRVTPVRCSRDRLVLPEEDYSTTIDIVLKDGKEALSEYKPVYRHKRPIRIPSFLKGIDKYEVFLNGKEL